MKEKIEDILNSYILDDLPSGMVSELSTLIQEEREDAYQDGLQANQMVDWMPSKVNRKEYENKIRKDAVEGFVREFNNKCLHDSINESYNYPLEEIPNVVYIYLEEYLESEGKK